MRKLSIFFLLLFLYSSPCWSSLYVAVFGGNSKLAADNNALKDKFTGDTLGFNLGFKLLFLAPEIGFRKTSVDGAVTHSAFDAMLVQQMY